MDYLLLWKDGFLKGYIGIFVLVVVVSFILFCGFNAFFTGGGDIVQETLLASTMVISILLSAIISQLFYLINLYKNKK